jgi:hypothetical protein
MTDQRFRTVYPTLQDAPEPKADNFWIAVECWNGWLQDYVSKDGKYVASGPRYYPATAG